MGSVWTIEFADSAARQLRKLGRFWKYRVGDYRVLAEIRDHEIRIVVVRLGHCSAVYR